MTDLLFRSPGGTPMKTNVKAQDDSDDPAAIIASALKRKFANVERQSPNQKPSSPEHWSPVSNHKPPLVVIVRHYAHFVLLLLLIMKILMKSIITSIIHGKPRSGV